MTGLPSERPAFGPSERPVVMTRGATIDWGRLCAAAVTVAHSLPSGTAAVNLCEDGDSIIYRELDFEKLEAGYIDVDGCFVAREFDQDQTPAVVMAVARALHEARS